MSVTRSGRRRFIRTAVAGTTGLFVSRCIPAAEQLEKFRFIIVSDTHLGRSDNQTAEMRWRRAVAEINELPGDFVLHLGDIVDSAREYQYPIYTAIRATLKKPIHEVPGNHDSTDQFMRHVSERTDRFVDYGGVRFVLFNNARRDSHDGFITSRQLQWIEATLAEGVTQGLKIVLCCHVPVHSNKHPDRGWHVKPSDGQTAFYELLQQYSEDVLACFHGHFHNGIRGWRDHGHTVEALCPSVCYNQDRGLTGHIAAGRADGFFVDELRPGYVLCELGAGRLSLQYKPLGEHPTGKYDVASKPAM